MFDLERKEKGGGNVTCVGVRPVLVCHRGPREESSWDWKKKTGGKSEEPHY